MCRLRSHTDRSWYEFVLYLLLWLVVHVCDIFPIKFQMSPKIWKFLGGTVDISFWVTSRSLCEYVFVIDDFKWSESSTMNVESYMWTSRDYFNKWILAEPNFICDASKPYCLVIMLLLILTPALAIRLSQVYLIWRNLVSVGSILDTGSSRPVLWKGAYTQEDIS